LPVDLSAGLFLKSPEPILGHVQELLNGNKRLIGVAPFARHLEKMYPLQKMKLFLQQLNERKDVQLLFFGAAGTEATQLAEWQQEFTGSVNVAGRISLGEELNLVSNLSLMISMDSANMHIASVYGVPVVSIWGATHPYAGFYGWGQDESHIVQAELYCRPCSVFGNKPCFRGDHACMHLISSEMIMQKVQVVLDRDS
jgi:ADP-heptose:LPS heptosyltransferase